MSPTRMFVAALALVGVFYCLHLFTDTPTEQVDDRVAPQVEEPVRVFSEQFYACPAKGEKRAHKERERLLQSVVAIPLTDPSAVCEQMLGGASSTSTVNNIKVAFVEDSTAGVVSDLTMTSQGRAEEITLNVELSLTDDGWKVVNVS